MSFLNRFCLVVVSILAVCSSPIWARQEVDFNHDWRFFRPADAHSTDISPSASVFADTAWDLVTVPHTVRLEPYDASGGRNYQGVCWYRKHFTPDAPWKNQKLLLRFDGAMQVADVYLNGKKIFTHYGGYLPFTIDITDAVQFGAENILALRLDNSDNPEVPPGKPENALDFCYFGGLYRQVHLDVVDRLHISDVFLANKPAGGGIFVSFPSVAKDAAVVQVQTEVINENTDAATASVAQELVDASGKVVASASDDLSLAAGESKTATQRLNVTAPSLWHPDHPYLYTLRTTINRAGKPTDTQETHVGIRTFKFDAQHGLTINGEKFVSLGANRHQDHPYVGYALSPEAQYRDAVKLREAGFTSIRSHYPQSPAFVDACDKLGMLLIVSNPGWQFAGDDVFTQRVYENARQMIRRDRNHACVILWEAQLNESNNRNLFPTLQKIVHEEYPFDPCYSAGDSAGGSDWDVVYLRNNGSKPGWIREIGDQVDNWSDQQSRSRVARGWGETAELVQAWSHVDAINHGYLGNGGGGRGAPTTAPVTPNERVTGIDLWAGVDAYRGYHHQAFLGAPIDLFRLPKFDMYFFQSQRPPQVHIDGINDGPMVFIANYATFQSPTAVTVFSNCQQVRLSQNGVEVATQSPMPGYALPHAPFSFKVGQFSQDQTTMFMTGVARPGTRVGELKAEGLIDGKVAATFTIRAPGVPAKLRLEADTCGRDLVADGNDWIRVHAYVCDARGTTHPYANDEITFSVEGEGTIIDDARIRANPIRAEAGIATALVRGTMHAGKITIRATAFGLTPAEMTLDSIAK